ncbi:uncharacterized protein DS421_17g597510 [Arachis hypogaea]|nr:uncharacterized protein DS421_17g597510 [Arachis hypogaea]
MMMVFSCIMLDVYDFFDDFCQMATHITFVYHHRGWLEKDADGGVKYNGGLLSIIERVHVDTCNLFLVEGLFLDLGYTRYNEVYWLEPGMDLANGLRVLRRDADVVKMCDAALRNENRVHLYFEHPVDMDPEYVEMPCLEDQENHDQEPQQNEEEEGSEHTEVEGGPLFNEANEQEDPPQHKEQQQQEDELTLNKRGYDEPLPEEAGTENLSNQGQAGTTENEALNEGDNQQTHVEDHERPSNPEEVNGRGRKRRKKHARPPPFGRDQPAPENNSEGHADEGASCGVQGRRIHRRPRPSGQRILPPREENQAPRVVVPNPNDIDEEPTEYQYHSEELHTPPGSDSEDENLVFPQYNPDTKFGKIRLELGMEFGTMQQFKDAVRKYSIQMGREAFFLKVEPHRCRVICYNETCPWEVYCARRNQPPSYQIKTLVDEHTCPRSNKSRSVTCKWVAEELISKIRVCPNLSHREAREMFKVEFDICVGERMMFRAMEKAKDVIEGTEKEQYLKLRTYLSELRKANPGSTCRMSTTPQQEGLPKFRSLYICLEACKRGFKEGCRPFLCLDGAFLKGYFGGQLLTAVAQDANNHLFPVAYGVVDAETKTNWKEFLEYLLDDIGDHRQFDWHFMSDKQKGLIPALQEVMPGVKHRFCTMHMWRNFNKRWKDLELKQLLFQCARALTDQEFNEGMDAIKRINTSAWEYLSKYEQETWSRSRFSTWPKVDNITNNNAESLNATMVGLRGKSIITMLEEIRYYLMKTMATHKDALMAYTGKLAPIQTSRLEKEKKEGNYWEAQWVGYDEHNVFEVRRHGRTVWVNTHERSCTCRKWQLTGLPCCHGIAAIQRKNQRPEDYVHHWLTMEAYNRTYQFHINTVPSQEYWADAEGLPCLPPPYKRPIGRPTKKRARHESERQSGSQYKIKRSYGKTSCKYCKKVNKNSLNQCLLILTVLMC